MSKFEIRREPIDVTYGDLFGGRADTHPQHIAGPTTYLIDGQIVTQEEYERAVKKAQKKGHGF